MTQINQQIVLITGATDGIGRATAAELARRGARLLLHGRDPEKLAQTRAAIAEASGNDRLDTVLADYASLAEVRDLAASVGDRCERLDVLINNAGIGSGRSGGTRELSADGHELRFQVNHLAPYLLSNLLLPLLRQAAPARVVNVASAAQSAIDFDDPMLERGYSGHRAYAQSKLAMVMATMQLARRHDPAAVTFNALHPGSLLDTKMVREGWGRPQGPVEIGVESEVHLATSRRLDGVSGQYFDRTRPSRAQPQAYDEAARARLESLTERLVAAAA